MGRRRLALPLVAVAIAAGTAAAAHAQVPDPSAIPSGDTATVPDPYATGEGLSQQAGAPDTDYTPTAKDTTDHWVQVQGAHYPDDHAIGSVTDFRDSLHTVSFLNGIRGYAGGARKLDCDGTPTEVPVVYRYGDLGGTGIGWSLDFVGTCAHPGFVGAISWIGGSGEAVAVGGSGSYPYREPAYREECQVGQRDPVTGVFTPTEAYGVKCDLAGDARAWQMTDGDWREITGDLPTDRIGNPLRGMTALQFAPNGRFGFAGALGQLLRWQGQGFDTYYDMHSPCPRSELAAGTAPGSGIPNTPTSACEFAEADRFRFRVRQIRFNNAATDLNAFAITDGCCSEDPLHNTPNVLAYGGEFKNIPRWYAAELDPMPSLLFDESDIPFAVDTGAQTAPGRLNLRQEMPDSFYSFSVGAISPGSVRFGAIAAPAAPEGSGPERSLITQPYCLSWTGRHNSPLWYVDEQAQVPDQAFEALRTRLSTVRLVAGDGDAAASFGQNALASLHSDFSVGQPDVFGGPTEASGGLTAGNCTMADTRTKADGIPDWAVGELRSTRTPLGSRGVALSTVLRPDLLPATLRTDPDLPAILAGDLPTDDKKLKAYASSLLLELSSYSLNAITVLPSGEGWAVGEHGGIVHEGGSNAALGAGAAEPEPPHLGSRQPAGVSSTGPYGGTRPPAAAGADQVPALLSRPLLSLSQPRMFAAGSPYPANDGPHDPIEDVRQLVMSRDGSEGWAIGASTLGQDDPFRLPTTTLDHYDGQSWSRCDPVGVEGQVDPDPACVALAPLRDYRDTLRHLTPVRLLAAARVPLEYDGDPSNDDEFKVVAATTPYRLAPGDPQTSGLVTYENGRWRPEPYGEYNALIGSSGTEPRTIAFTAPDDGWVWASSGGSSPTSKLLHFDGSHWMNCTPGGSAPAGCADPGCPAAGKAGLLCFHAADGSRDVIRGMSSSGPDLFIYGSREYNGSRYPFVIHRHAGGPWSADPQGGGLDPVATARNGGTAPTADQRGEVQSLAVAPQPGGGLEGWAVGSFGARSVAVPRVDGNSAGVNATVGGELQRLSPVTSLMRFSGAWRPFDDTGPIADYLKPRLASRGYCSQSSLQGSARACDPGLPDTDSNLQISLPDGGNGPTAVIAQRSSGRLFGFDPRRNRWALIDQPRSPADAPSFGSKNEDGWLDGPMKALAGDGQGGIWAVVGHVNSNVPHDDFEHFTSRPPAPVFTEAPSPLRDGESFTSLAGSPDGTVWGTTRSGVVFRYDRALGWDRVSIPGWDPGRVVTRPSRALAVAAGPNGEGVMVGERGRIAELAPDQVRLDRAAGTSCSLRGSADAPCGTGFDLQAVAVAPQDGSAIAGGKRLSLVWRPGGGDFRAITPPPGNAYDTITGVALPNPGEAYVATDSGQIFRGTGGEGGWSWVRENLNPRSDVPESLRGDVVTLDNNRVPIPLRAISVDRNGHGYAVGDNGLILERVAEGEHAWRRLRTPFADDLTTVAVPASGGDGTGALIGGRNGLILTANGAHADLARPADGFDSDIGSQTGPITGLAIVPGDREGETEAWAATAGRDPEGSYTSVDYNRSVGQLLHYSSDSSDPWLDPVARAKPLPDVPPPRPGELSFAAMGRAGCRLVPPSLPCLDMNGSRQDFEVATKRAVDQIAAQASAPGGPAFTLFTGDSVDTAGTPGTQETERQLDLSANGLGTTGLATRHETVNGPRKLRRFRDSVVDPLALAGAPLFAASGGQDLSAVNGCAATCAVATRGVAGDNLAWRQTFEGEPGPWGDGGPPPDTQGLSFAPLPDSSDSVRTTDQNLPDADQGLPTGDGPLTASKLGTGGASTHYALDISRGGDRVARLVVADTSLRSLQASDPMQQPAEPRGQLLWLDRMTCLEGQTATDGSRCTRSAGEQAIVLTNTPTYSYGPGALTDTDTTDGTQLEQILMQNQVNVVVAGRLGWNGLYYATAPGLHTPCAGDPYPSGPPHSAVPDCSGAAGGGPGTGGALGRILPFVVASDVAGNFGPDGGGAGSAADGYWHGYTIVRLSPDGDPAKTIVEQRPVLDWIQIQPRGPHGDTHTLRAGKRLDLVGVGREPIAASTADSRQQETRYDEISSPAITHRFDLLEADPDQPWMPKPGTRDDGCDPYDCLDSNVGTIDRQSGEVKAGSGDFPKTYAVAELSVAARSATYPLVFQPRASYRPTPPPPSIPAVVPPPASPPAPANPTSPSVNAPPAPTIPVLAAQAPPPPPAPPAPPTFASQAPIDLTITPTALDISPPTAVSQPPTPPVNPAPPSGARREARQRQAAAQKSGADSDQEGSEAQDAGGDLAQGPPTDANAASRHDFTALADRRQPSAWTRDLLLGGGLGIAALILSFGLRNARPTPRRRRTEAPAPAWSKQRR